MGVFALVKTSAGFALICSALLTLPHVSPGASVRAPALYAANPFEVYSDTLPRLYTIENLSYRIYPSLSRGLFSWRPYIGGVPAGRMSSGAFGGILDRSLLGSTRLTLRDSFRESSIPRSRERGSLLPTIYLPIDMPPIIARTIGEGGQLDISGHQKITLSGITHVRPNAVEVEGQSTSLFPDLRMEQELVVQLNGTIGEKIHVDVDHNSERQYEPENRIRLAYEGWEDEIIQSIEVGDVSLSISGPEFVAYSIPHQGLFGAKMISQVGPVDITTIASKEASSVESAEFVGQATMVTDSILDIHPAGNTFYLTFPDSVQQPVITHIRVFRDDLDGTNNDETGAVEGTWFLPDSTGPGWWDELLQGPYEDFVLVDDSTAIRFNTPVNEAHVLAVFMVADGVTYGDSSLESLDLKLIKESNPLPSYPTWSYELRNRYFLGSNNIVPESFNCSIFLTRAGEAPVSTQNGVPFIEILGLDTNGDGSLVDERSAVDWENGYLVFPDCRPFENEGLEIRNPLVYDKRNPDPADSRYFIAVEYRAASTTFSLGRIGIVAGSEVVTLNVSGQTRTLTRDVDYTIVYEIGILTLMGEAAELAQNPSNVLSVRFEYLPFMAVQQRTLFGTRAVYTLGSGTWIGATAMFEDADTPDDRPRVGEEPTRTLVTDIDARYEASPRFLTDAVNHLPGINTDAESRFVLSGELAASFPNPNTSGKAYIDDMEGTESSLSLQTMRQSWHRSSAPGDYSVFDNPPGTLQWYNFTNRWLMRQIITNCPDAQKNDKVNSVLEMVFDPAQGSSSSWGGLMRCIDPYGLDFSSRTRVRLYVRATGSARDARLYLDLGERIDEDSYWLERTGDTLEIRANGRLDTEDADGNGSYSNGEDTGLDGLMDEDEYPLSTEPDPNRDNYFLDESLPIHERYRHVNGTEGNSVLDTEDLNGNGMLDRANSFFRIEIPLNDPDYVISGPNEYGWMLVEIPLSDTSLVTVPAISGSNPTWEKISYARLWMEGFTQRDTINVYDFAVVGNRWEQRAVVLFDSIGIPVATGEELIVSTVNNQDSYEYAADPPPGVSPGRDENGDLKLEQSLALAASNILPGHEGLATQYYYSSENYTGYSTIRYPVHGDSRADGEFFLRMGRDTLNYYEIVTALAPGWQQVEVDLNDLASLRERKQESGLVFLRQGNLAVRGNPSLSDVMALSAGVRNTKQGSLTTTVWLDDIVLLNPYGEPDYARRLSAMVEMADLIRLNGDYRSVGADFHSLGATSGQGRTITRFGSDVTLYTERFTPRTWFLSMPASYAWSREYSEPRFQSGSDRRLDGDEAWENRTQTDRRDTNVTLRRNRSGSTGPARYLLDPWQLGHAYGLTLGRSPLYMDTTRTARGQIGYDLGLPRIRLLSLPVAEFFSPWPTRIAWNVIRQNNWDTRWEQGDADTVQTRAVRARTLGTDFSLAFGFWKGQSSSFSLGVGRDLLYPWYGDLSMNTGREVNRTQNLSLSQDLNLLNLLMPRLSYDAVYRSSRLAPHTTSGRDSLGRPGATVSATKRLNLRVGLVQALRYVARLRDERLDEQAPPGSPRWILARLDRWSGNITDPTIVIARTEGTDYRELVSYPDYRYRLGLEPILDGIVPYDRTISDNLQVSGGVRPISSMSVRSEYARTDTRHFYSGYWNRRLATTWPSVSVSWTGLERFAPLERILRSGTLSTGYRVETTESGRFEDDEYIRTSKTESTRWSPLFSISGTLKNTIQITLSDNVTNSVTINYTGTRACTRSNSNSFSLNLQYAFSAPGGLSIPLPLLDRLRVSFRSELTTALRITRTRTGAVIEIPGFEDRVQSDRVEWRIEPSANYDFGTVTAGMTAIYGWKTDGVNSIYDQKDVGLDVWVMINF